MRYRHANSPFSNGDQQVKALISSTDALSTQEQEEVIVYFARSLRTSTQLLKVVVCLHAVLALVYACLLCSGSLLIDLSVDVAATAHLVQLAKQMLPPTTAGVAGVGTPSQDPLAALAALDADQRAAQRRHLHDYLSGGTSRTRQSSALSVVAAAVMVYSVALLLWAAWSGYDACRRLRVNVDELTGTEPRELVGRRAGGGASPAAAPATAEPPTPRRSSLRQRCRDDPAAAQYAAAALASLAALFWLTALVHRQRTMQSAYAELGLQTPSVLSWHTVTDAALEYLLAVWQPLFHLGIGLLVHSMLHTRENLVSLSRLKYRFDKV
ncbi:hypothetical protein NESM_000444500 [Novymonas esmeraldas]|uniref:Uncharacterized protein n=1 Tax=Novymonas esmeraldas TaxID=1808958 RepID=A0AAW0ENF9_9TRYP